MAVRKTAISKLGPIAKSKLPGMAKASAKGRVMKTAVKQRTPYERQPAKMSSTRWKELQKGMDEKWPAPKYMEHRDDKRAHTCYMDETYMEITRWTAQTQIRYRPHAKAPGSKSHVRYEKYSRARTVAEALKLGSWPADWCWDFERGFIKVVGGRRREEPIDSSETDLKNLDEVDRILARWFVREAARMLGVSMKTLKEDPGAKEDLLLRMKRTIAEGKAREILTERAASRSKLTDADVLSVLRLWGFRKNVTRINVQPTGSTFVFSDTMGLVADRTGGIAPTKYTLAYPNVSKVLCSYLEDNLPRDMPRFHFTSINVNKNYAGRRHRDGNNLGPSVIKAFGNFTGGHLHYFPSDDRSLDLDDLPSKDMVSLDLNKHMALFDGRRAHQVEAFKGERYSLVWFTCPRNERVDAQRKAGMIACGFPMPTKQDSKRANDLMPPPSGYDKAGRAPRGRASVQAYRTWVPK